MASYAHYSTPAPGFSGDVKRRDWNVAGTDYYATDEAFNTRVMRKNKRMRAGLKRSLFADTKANRAAYVDSPNFKYTPAPSEDGDLAPWIRAWPTAVLDSVAA